MRCGPAPGTPEARDWSASTARFAPCSVPPGSSPTAPSLSGSACWRVPDERACVRLDHLRLDRPQTVARAASPRRERGSGSKREVRPGVWELAVSLGPGPDGRTRRRYRTILGDEGDANQALADLAETAHGPSRLGDLRVRGAPRPLPHLARRRKRRSSDRESPQDRRHGHRTRLRTPVRRPPRHRRHRWSAAGSTPGRRVASRTDGDPRTPRSDLPLGPESAVDDAKPDNGHPDPRHRRLNPASARPLTRRPPASAGERRRTPAAMRVLGGGRTVFAWLARTAATPTQARG